MVIYTDLRFDDRVRKEILTIQRIFPNVSFKIFVLFPDNRNEEGVTDYGVPYKAIHSGIRDKYPSNSHLLLKAIDHFRIIRKEVKGYDAIWCADPETVLVAALIKTKYLLWDLHELPIGLTYNRLGRLCIKQIFNRCKVIVHANPQRIDYLESIGCIKDKSKHIALRNYPQFDDIDSEYDELYDNFIKWKQGRRCVYLQGLTGDGRSDYETIASVLSFPDLIAVIVGRFNENTKSRLLEKFGENTMAKRVFFVGAISQLKIPQYIKQCFTSLIFYKNVSPNNYYCEANRFYQAVIMGLPVVVGNNPSMKELVDKYGFGVSIDDDGGNIEMIISGLKEVINNYDVYQSNIEKNKKYLSWDIQDPEIIKIVNLFLCYN